MAGYLLLLASRAIDTITGAPGAWDFTDSANSGHFLTAF